MTMRRNALLAVSLSVALAGCASATIEDAVPMEAAEPAPPAAALPQGQEPAFSAPGEYPNLNVVPRPAAAQFTDAEREARAAALRATHQQQRSGPTAGGVRDRSAELRRLANRHAQDALREIESE